MSEAGTSSGVTLWMFDFDGTLATIVADRTAAELAPACRSMLHQLTKKRTNYCAVISSRLLADLEDRVDVPGIYLSGGSGLEWKLPDGRRRTPESTWMDSIKAVREALIPEIHEWGRLPGVEIEDKQWSVAIHLRQATQQTQHELVALMQRWQRARKVPVFRGPAVIEIQLLPDVDKSSGVRTFCDLVHYARVPGGLVYAGDDENDAAAMQLVRKWGGTVIAVGKRALVPGCQIVADPTELANHIRRLDSLRGATEK
jgi:trehalose 6-phosphate phosphatase